MPIFQDLRCQTAKTRPRLQTVETTTLKNSVLQLSRDWDISWDTTALVYCSEM